jgi:hypothetical protein
MFLHVDHDRFWPDPASCDRRLPAKSGHLVTTKPTAIQILREVLRVNSWAGL